MKIRKENLTAKEIADLEKSGEALGIDVWNITPEQLEEMTVDLAVNEYQEAMSTSSGESMMFGCLVNAGYLPGCLEVEESEYQDAFIRKFCDDLGASIYNRKRIESGFRKRLAERTFYA